MGSLSVSWRSKQVQLCLFCCPLSYNSVIFLLESPLPLFLPLISLSMCLGLALCVSTVPIALVDVFSSRGVENGWEDVGWGVLVWRAVHIPWMWWRPFQSSLFLHQELMDLQQIVCVCVFVCEDAYGCVFKKWRKKKRLSHYYIYILFEMVDADELLSA